MALVDIDVSSVGLHNSKRVSKETYRSIVFACALVYILSVLNWFNIVWTCINPRTATDLDITLLLTLIFEKLKSVEVSKNHLNIIRTSIIVL